MKTLRLILTGLLLAAPLAAAHAQVAVGVAVGPTYAPYDGYVEYAPPPVCDWGYYPYYPYACAPYGYYGPSYFYDGIFIGVGPWYGWGWRNFGWFHGWHGYRGGYGHPDAWSRHPENGYSERGGRVAVGRPIPGGGRAYSGGNYAPRSGYSGGARAFSGGGSHGFSGGGHAMSGGGGFHGGGGGRR